MEKKCSNPECFEVKPLTEFYKGRNKCKKCTNAVSTNWNKNNRAKIRAHRKIYYRNRLEKAKQGDLAAIRWLEKINEKRKILVEKKRTEREIERKDCAKTVNRKYSESIKLLLIKDGVDKNAIDSTMIEVKIKDLEIKRVLKKLNAPWREGIVYERSTKKPVVPGRYLDSVSRNGGSLWLNMNRVFANARNVRKIEATALN